MREDAPGAFGVCRGEPQRRAEKCFSIPTFVCFFLVEREFSLDRAISFDVNCFFFSFSRIFDDGRFRGEFF